MSCLNVFALFSAVIVLHEGNSAGTDEEGLHPHQAHQKSHATAGWETRGGTVFNPCCEK